MLSNRGKQDDHLVSHVFLTQTNLAVMSCPPAGVQQQQQQQVSHPVERAVVALLLGALMILLLTVSNNSEFQLIYQTFNSFPGVPFPF